MSTEDGAPEIGSLNESNLTGFSLKRNSTECNSPASSTVLTNLPRLPLVTNNFSYQMSSFAKHRSDVHSESHKVFTAFEDS